MPVTEKVLEPSKNNRLTASDRCDRCGAQAYYIVTFASTFELLLCKHDFDKNEDKLKETAINIEDESHKLTNK